jgi:alanine dehydrogenase
VLHYCVANMPGAVPRTSTFALTNSPLPYTLKLANQGFLEAIGSDPGLKAGVNTFAGHCTYPGGCGGAESALHIDRCLIRSYQRVNGLILQ